MVLRTETFSSKWEGGEGSGKAVSVDKAAGEIRFLGIEDQRNPRR
jgi:hypothetical protein